MHIMELTNLEVLQLHKYPEYLKECCDLINDEWPRSETARMMSLQASCDLLPTSLILISDRKVIGHCKLTPIPSMPESCFIETVVISKKLRGKKLGSYLMRKVEDYCRNILHLKMVHLSTKGQENFYGKLGYVICEPVSIYGCQVPNNIKSTQYSNKSETSVPVLVEAGAPPPPPPPPMPKLDNVHNNNVIKSNKTYMFKYLN